MANKLPQSLCLMRAGAAVAAALGLTVAGWTTLSAWGLQGHRLVAKIAESRLNAVAKQNVAWLLDGRSAADVSSWADDYLGGNFQTSFWHYVNIPPDAAAYDRDRDCPRQPTVAAGARNDRWRDCIVDRIPYSLERLGDLSLDRADRAVALKFLVHFVGDLHQPFHALGVERGGNGILVTVFGSTTCGGTPAAPTPCNLHGVWDSSLIGRRKLGDAEYLALLEKTIAANNLANRPVGTSAEWAMESVALSKAALLPQQGIVDEQYFQAHIVVVEERVALAGLRLAAMLNATLTTAPPVK